MTAETNTGHGHVFPRPDGVKARCGGPALCHICAADLARKNIQERVRADPPASNEQSIERLEAIGRSAAGCLITENGIVWHPANELLWAAGEIKRLKREIAHWMAVWAEKLEARSAPETSKSPKEEGDASLAPTPGHPEERCERCHRPNGVWYAPSELWNAAHVNWDILCPVCFMELAKAVGIDPTAWVLAPEVLLPEKIDDIRQAGQQGLEDIREYGPALIDSMVGQKTNCRLCDAGINTMTDAATGEKLHTQPGGTWTPCTSSPRPARRFRTSEGWCTVCGVGKHYPDGALQFPHSPECTAVSET